MRKNFAIAAKLSLVWVAVVLCQSKLAYSQHGSSVLPGTASIQEVLDEGLQIERDHRWQEAIQHYEKAFRADRTAKEIEHRLQISRIHYDVVRRYSDSTFLAAIDTMPAPKALDLYNEVLAKLEVNYVETIQLADLLRNGTAFLEVALTEPEFVKANIRASQDKIENFRANIHKAVLGRPIKNRNEARALVLNVATLANQQLGIPQCATIHEYVAGAVGLLDPYSGYMTSGELSEVMSQIEGNLIGLGVELWAEENDLRIIEVFEGSPAFDAGLRAGDRILQVGSARTDDVSAKRAADLLRGPENSQVRLVLAREDRDSIPVVVTRRRVIVKSVPTAELADETERIGYIRITNFQKSTADEVDQALLKLNRQGMRSLIIDLRRNPGGLLDSSVEVADRFLRQGYIVTTRGRNGVENRNYSAREPQTWDVPLVVLIDGDSASASEIFAGAIRDHRRGTIVGQTSYGKGSVQGLFQTDTAAGGLRLTVSKFFSPLGHPISMHGVSPDVVVESEVKQQSAKPIVGTDGKFVELKSKPSSGSGTKLIDFRNRQNDVALSRAVEVAREANKLALRAK